MAAIRLKTPLRRIPLGDRRRIGKSARAPRTRSGHAIGRSATRHRMDWPCRLLRFIADSLDWPTTWSLSRDFAHVPRHPSARGGPIPSQVLGLQLLQHIQRERHPWLHSSSSRSFRFRSLLCCGRRGLLCCGRRDLGHPPILRPVVPRACRDSEPRQDREAQAASAAPRARRFHTRRAAQQANQQAAEAHHAQGHPGHHRLRLHRLDDSRCRLPDQPETMQGALPRGDRRDHEGRMHRRPACRGGSKRRHPRPLPDPQRARHPELQIHSPLVRRRETPIEPLCSSLGLLKS